MYELKISEGVTLIACAETCAAAAEALWWEQEFSRRLETAEAWVQSFKD